jgi:ferredoxin/coenzyme F420-reducing hydrogenase delta subunit
LPKSIRRPLQGILLFVEAGFDRPFGARGNPLRYLGSLAFFFFWIAAVSGIYVFILFETSVVGAYASIEYMTHDQWYLAGVMRSLHRYSSDAMVVTTMLHLVREFIFDRYRGMRWFAWFTGIPTLWLLYISGISGYWLIWDQLAQYVAIASMEWLDWLGIFGEPVANNFLAPASLSDRFFTLLVFMHIFAPLFLLFLMWIHVLRMSRPKVNPPRSLAVGSLMALTVLSLIKPALSHAPANLGIVPTDIGLDWFYLLFYPLYDAWGSGALWALAIGVSLMLSILPWLPPLRRPRAAEVFLEHCNGCARCYDDCPFEAISMRPRSDGGPFEQEAVVDADMCTRCGICVGACPPSTPFRTTPDLKTGIDLPDFSLKDLKALTTGAVERSGEGLAEGGARAIFFTCDNGVEAAALEEPGLAGVSLPCIGMLPPSFIDFVLSRGGEGAVLVGCRECDCHNRFGVDWAQQRLAGERDPQLRKRVSRRHIKTLWAARTDLAVVRKKISLFRKDIALLDGDVVSDDGANSGLVSKVDS